MAVKITRKPFGELPDGAKADAFTLTNESGASVSFTAYGGTILSILVPDRAGELGDVTLGYPSLAAMRVAGGYMNALVGRYANRIGGASFELDGKTYRLAANDGVNHLHGGAVGFDKKIWRADEIKGGVRLGIISPDGEEGYPGELSVAVTYTWNDANELGILYEAVSDGRTILNLTNHAYFNLSGPSYPNLDRHSIRVDADAITAVSGAGCIPTGERLPVENTPLDLRSLRNISEGLSEESTNEQMRFGSGYDHNYIINGAGMRLAAEAVDFLSGRTMRVYTDQPGVQFYSGNHISGTTIGKAGVPYRRRQGFCLETQNFPDAIHHPDFPSCVLSPGEVYRRETRFAFGTDMGRSPV
ncbi:MAG: galactose mutarotase [Oscillospiraceae bacterium]|jgi:aldose 1-epimerase|nr:galactose mutarotase [Oscillospiraceae bacterium]